MGNKQQTPRALLELAEDSLTTMTDFYYKECIVATADQSAALAMFFQSPTDVTGETKGGSSDDTSPPHIVASQARAMLTNTLTSIISALLGRPISQASNKDRRATNEEKEAIAIILSPSCLPISTCWETTFVANTSTVCCYEESDNGRSIE